MTKLLATIKKDLLILSRDKVGLLFMFVMPVILALLITAVQNSTFDLVNNNKVSLLLFNADSGTVSRTFADQINNAGIFELTQVNEVRNENEFKLRMKKEDALVGIMIPPDFSEKIEGASNGVTKRILSDLGVTEDPANENAKKSSPGISVFFNPVLQESFRYSIRGAVGGALQLTENKQLLKTLYSNFNDTANPKRVETLLQNDHATIHETTLLWHGSSSIPNATQHNIPAWTVFAMFFVVISLGSSIVKEKLNGSFLRLRTLPTSFMISLISKQITYLVVTILQAMLIFLVGVLLFPLMNLPTLVLPENSAALLGVTFFSGWCAVSFALCVGVYARTQEQSNGFGAVTVVILAAVGGILVPSFAMPHTLQVISAFSPLHWCLESYYGLFLRNENWMESLGHMRPLIIMIVILQLMAYSGLKQKKLI